MKTWTIVIEIKDNGDNASGSPYTGYMTKSEIEMNVSRVLENLAEGYMQFQIFECTEAPYGPQGVVLKDAKP